MLVRLPAYNLCEVASRHLLTGRRYPTNRAFTYVQVHLQMWYCSILASWYFNTHVPGHSTFSTPLRKDSILIMLKTFPTALWLSVILLGIHAVQPATAQDIVTNGGFETGDLTGWTLTNSEYGYSGWTSYVSPYVAHTGNYFFVFGGPDYDATLSQTLTTVAGSNYELTFWLASDGNTPNDFSASFDGTTVFSATNIPFLFDPNGNYLYTKYTYDVTASTTSTVLSISGLNAPGDLMLDDVSVIPAISSTPEPGSIGLLMGMTLTTAGFLTRRRSR